jgi:hypothetical protein
MSRADRLVQRKAKFGYCGDPKSAIRGIRDELPAAGPEIKNSRLVGCF